MAPGEQGTVRIPLLADTVLPSLPYGITAIDYHFHDAHPSQVLEALLG